jgi:hypothetical protein
MLFPQRFYRKDFRELKKVKDKLAGCASFRKPLDSGYSSPRCQLHVQQSGKLYRENAKSRSQKPGVRSQKKSFFILDSEF